MDSTDEKIYKKQKMIQEAEAREQSKRAQKELQRRAMEMKQQGLANDKMKSMSSADFQPKIDPTEKRVPSGPTQQPGMAAQPSQSKSNAGMFGVEDIKVQELGGGQRSQ